MSSKFKRTKENFSCEKCGLFVEGDGYTNHCPECLWSKHLDISPGDRMEECTGMMEPVGVEKNGQDYTIIHKCLKCGVEKPNKAVPKDNFQMFIQISAENLK